MKIVLVEPGKEARLAEISGSLQSMQQLVGGIIQAIYPWTDPVAMICHDEGKILGLPFNRVLEDYDLIAGPFFICGIQGENFASLTDQQVKTYLEKFRRPQIMPHSSWPDGQKLFGTGICGTSPAGPERHSTKRKYASIKQFFNQH